MSDTILDGPATTQRPSGGLTPVLFALAIFTSAALVFTVQPMVTKLVLPMLGGSPSVWNTSMVFFQTALLAGYAYAHVLQRVRALKMQVAIHLVLLLLAATFLPLRVSGLLGDPSSEAPILWLLGTLAISVGAPFAVLSATAPLLQAWYARVRAGHADGKNPYVLYAASNLGSFLALIAYPVVIEPLATLSGQRWSWSGGYALFILMVAGLAFLIARRRVQADAETPPLERSPAISWKEKGLWILLAAAPSSLMLGVTTHLSTDVASAPFLWVLPLALYLLTFVIAFSTKPAIPLPTTLILQGALLAVCVSIVAFRSSDLIVAFVVTIATFFFTTLMCHQLLAARRPAPDRLTEFYLLMSLGGVVGGAFNALIAPVIFDMVWEFPLVLVAVGLFRPWRSDVMLKKWEAILLIVGVLICLVPPLLSAWFNENWDAAWAFNRMFNGMTMGQLAQLILGGAAICAFLLRDRAVMYVVLLALISLSAQWIARGYDWSHSDRSFFGVMRIANVPDPTFGGDVHVMMHGTTLHGAQSQGEGYRCMPTLYYAPNTPIGQSALMIRERGPSANIGVVGQGTGAMAAYKRADDRLTFFEIDPMVDQLSRDPQWFSFINGCADGPVRTVIGDARLTLEREPEGGFDLLIIDAFSSDAVPTHLLTQEALAGYLKRVKPNGVVLLHVSNRHLDIAMPAIAAARALGVPELHQTYIEGPDAPDMLEASTEAIILSPTEAGLADFRADTRWNTLAPTEVRPWTDDYVNLIGAFWRSLNP